MPLSRIPLTLAILAASCVAAQTTPAPPPPPQTARQALIEMFFGEAPEHVEKHLAETTKQALAKMGAESRQGAPAFFSTLSAQAKAGGAKVETFDVGPTLFKAKGLSGRKDDEIEISVERDDLTGGEDQIELAVHLVNDGKEEKLLSQILRFTFSMKMESDVWRLVEIGANAHLPIADPGFLKAWEEYQSRQNEQMSLYATRTIITAEKSYQSAQGSYACKLSALGPEKDAPHHNYLYDTQLAGGKKHGYIFSISECDPAHYRLGAEPEAKDLELRAYCSDETGVVRSSSDGKTATCFISGEVVENKFASGIARSASAPTKWSSSATAGSSPPSDRVHLSWGDLKASLITKIPPTYPPLAKQSRIQGQVILTAQINDKGDVTSLEVVSGHPMLAPAAMDAVKQWKYRPYLVNGKAVNVETQVTVNFELSER